MENVAEAFGHEAEVGSFTPDEKKEARVDETEAGIIVLVLAAEKRTPFSVILEQLSVQEGDGALDPLLPVGAGMRGRGSALAVRGRVVSKEEDHVFSLILHIVCLETKEISEPIHDVP
jgi:hypothetical protein